MKEKKWGFVVNPTSGGGYGATVPEKIRQYAENYGATVEVALTAEKRDGVRLAKDFVDKGFSHVVAVGGDGTYFEVLQSVAEAAGVTFGIVPAGTGNDFTRALGYTDHFLEEDWKVFFEENTKEIDVGFCNGHYFINGVGMGFDSLVASQVHKVHWILRGKGKYWWNVIKYLFIYKSKVCRLVIDGVDYSYKSFFVTVGNGRLFGGGFPLTPRAIVNDGLFDVCVAENYSLFMRVRELLRVIKSSHVGDKGMHYYNAKHVYIEFDEDLPYHMDGEIYLDKKFDIQMHEKKLKIIINPYKPNFFS